MADENAKAYKELQLEELKTLHGVEVDPVKRDPKSRSGRPEDAEIAKLYEDAAEYEGELERFKEELEIIRNHDVKALASALAASFQDEDQNYAQELKAVIETGWKQRVEVDQTHPQAQLELVRDTRFGDIAEKLAEAWPGYEGDFEAEIKGMLVQRWELYIEIKKEHIKEETSYIKTLGLKPDYAKKVYNRYHGIE
jgi:hypothetical protein